MQEGRLMPHDSSISNVNDCHSAADMAAGSVTDSRSSSIHQPNSLAVRSADLRQIQRLAEATPNGIDNVQDVYPLSPLQHGILFHHIENEGRDTYVLSVLFSAESRSQVNLLTETLSSVINRHDVLRTAVIWEGVSQPVQLVHGRVELPVFEVALRPDQDPIEQLREQARSGRHRFDLQNPPLMRLWIAHQPPEARWHAVFQVHHMVCDHLSLIQILAEVAACLEEREQDRKSVV